MILRLLRVRDFRNLRAQEVGFGPGVNFLHGENAQGKTNVLEAVHLLSTLQSFRTRRLRDLIQEGCEGGRIEGRVADGWGETGLAVALSAAGKEAWADGKEPASTTEYLRIFPTVFFGPADMDLAGGDQAMRRRHLDRAAFLLDPSHLDRLRRYRRALLQRNAALAAAGGAIEPWTRHAALFGWEVHEARRKALEKMEPLAASLQREISGGRENGELRLAASWGSGEGVESLERALRDAEEEDRQRGYTRHGPHRDRLVALLDGKDLSAHGSRGQQRTFALSLKLALLLLAKEEAEILPAFLLDDPGSELDRRRLGFLASFLDGWEGQVFIASAGREDLPLGDVVEKRLFRLEQGRVLEGS
jgi:DNA replication and repair protein RecF